MIRRQIPGASPYRLQFRVKFFVQPQYLLQDSTRLVATSLEFINCNSFRHFLAVLVGSLKSDSVCPLRTSYLYTCTKIGAFSSLVQAPVFLALKERLGGRQNNPRTRKSSICVCFDCSSNRWRSWRFVLALRLLSGDRDRISVDFRVQGKCISGTFEAQRCPIGCSETVLYQRNVLDGELRN